MTELSTGTVAAFSTPTRSKSPVHIADPLGRSLRDGDSLRVSQSLCRASAATDALAVQPCSALPGPRIEGPSAGQRAVIVAEAVPGARVRVWDNASPNLELGDGSGGVIGLNRALAGNEVVTVNQQVGSCVSQQGYQVTVRAVP